MQCPDCGAQVEALVEGSCPRCFPRRHQLARVPPHVDVMLCAACNALKRGKSWEEPGGRSRDEIIERAVVYEVQIHRALEDTHVEVAVTPQDERNLAFDVMVEGRIDGVPLDALYATVARIKQAACTACSREAGGYYSAILQVRGADREPTDAEREEAGGLVIRAIDEMRQRGNPNSFLTKQGKVRGGHDFFISEIDVARIVAKRVASRFDADVKESPKLVGRKEGKDVYRVTFLVRIPPYRRGDFIETQKDLYRVEEVNPRTLVLRGLSSGRQTTIPRDQVTARDVVAKKADAKEMLVVSVVRDEALVLDPISNETHEVVLPPDFKYDLSIRSLRIVIHDEQAYFAGLPEYKTGLPVL
jgi:nonsense-mediated mRNA decay protein 3